MRKIPQDEMQKYLMSTFTIEAGNRSIIKIAQDVTESLSNDEAKAIELFYYVRDSIHYNFYMISAFIEDFRASRILEWGKGYCVQKAVLLTSLGRAAGIPTRLVFAKVRNHKLPPKIFEMIKTNVLPRHGYNQFLLNEKWVTVAPTFDKRLCDKHGLPTVEFDGKADALLPEKDVEGEPFIEYLEKFPPREDLPFDWIAPKIAQLVGSDKRPCLNKIS